MLDQVSLRATIIEILLGMGELDRGEADALAGDPRADFEFERLSFDSLVVLDFCLRIETVTGIVIDPDEIAAIVGINELESVLHARRAG
jgi:acyl carrier protein